jgi:hypothetical protein
MPVLLRERARDDGEEIADGLDRFDVLIAKINVERFLDFLGDEHDLERRKVKILLETMPRANGAPLAPGVLGEYSADEAGGVLHERSPSVATSQAPSDSFVTGSSLASPINHRFRS